MASITDAFAVVTVTNREYEKLIRESEQLATVKKLLEANDYVSSGDLRTILDIKEKEKENEPV